MSVERSRNISVFAACTKQGVLYHKIQNSSYNGETFKEVMIELKNHCQEIGIVNPLYIMDNARIHHYTGFKEVLEENGIKILYLPPYSYFLNSIENVFAVWKNEILRAEVKTEVELWRAIRETFNKLENSICDGFYRKMLGYLNRSLNYEKIYE